MADTKKRRGGTKSRHTTSREAPPLHGIAENLYSLQQDLEIARKIQTKLLPPKPQIPGFDFEVFYQPAGEVGGGFYDFLPLGGGRMGLLVADASGKGPGGG